MSEPEPFWQWWVKMTTPAPPPEPPPEREPDSWTLEKAANRLRKQVDRLESGRWLPRLPYRLNAGALKTVRRELEESHQLLNEVPDVLAEVRRG